MTRNRPQTQSQIPLHTGEQVRRAEEPLLAQGHGPQLMARAAYGLAQAVIAQLRGAGTGLYGAQVTGLIGPGNNGGDGLYALAALRRRGVDARAVVLRGRAHPEALAAFRAAGGRLVSEVGRGVEVLIDAVVGTGFTGGFSVPEVSGLEDAIARPRTRVIACDLPSGVDPDTGEVRTEVIPADLTVTFGGQKLGLVVGEGAQASGRIHAVEIGMEDQLGTVRSAADRSRDLVVADPLPSIPDPRDHKYSRGVAHLVAGSPRYPGAASLTAGAAVGTGCGMVTLHAPGPVAGQVIARRPEVVGVLGAEVPERARAVAVGPGLDEDPGQITALEHALGWSRRTDGRLILDASALTLLAGLTDLVGEGREDSPTSAPLLPRHTLLTPHLGEIRALMEAAGRFELRETVTRDPVGAVEAFADHLGCTVLLKGPSTIIADAAGQTLVHQVAAPGLAAAGSGDVLTGILAALAATAADCRSMGRIAAAAVHRHAEAARRIDPQARGRFGASDLLTALG